MDTDGTVTTTGQCSFQNTNQELAVGCENCCTTLASRPGCVHISTHERHASRQVDYRVNFQAERRGKDATQGAADVHTDR